MIDGGDATGYMEMQSCATAKQMHNMPLGMQQLDRLQLAEDSDQTAQLVQIRWVVSHV